MEYAIKGRTRPKFEPNETKVKAEGYGWRKSIHSAWMHALPYEHIEQEDWPIEASMFLEKLASGDKHASLKICAASPQGEIIHTKFVNPYEHEKIEDMLADFANAGHNLLFDPVIWRNGKRLRKSRVGFGTVTNGHPFDFFPEPSIYWAVGVKAFQFLLPLHEPMKLGEVSQTAQPADLDFYWSQKPKRNDLMIIPGSLIHNPFQPPFTAEVLFDAFSVTDIDNSDDLWSKY